MCYNTFMIKSFIHKGLQKFYEKGSTKGIQSIKVSANWRITFRFIDGDVEIINYEDYH